jgi:transcription elongation factor Elf1
MRDKDMTIKEFIEKAIEGGWKWNHKCDTPNCDDIYLDPKAWQAVEKLEGWDKVTSAVCPCCGTCNDMHPPKLWHDVSSFHMHRMIDALCEGKSIEEFLKDL